MTGIIMDKQQYNITVLHKELINTLINFCCKQTKLKQCIKICNREISFSDKDFSLFSQYQLQAEQFHKD